MTVFGEVLIATLHSGASYGRNNNLDQNVSDRGGSSTEEHGCSSKGVGICVWRRAAIGVDSAFWSFF